MLHTFVIHTCCSFEYFFSYQNKTFYHKQLSENVILLFLLERWLLCGLFFSAISKTKTKQACYIAFSISLNPKLIYVNFLFPYKCLLGQTLWGAVVSDLLYTTLHIIVLACIKIVLILIKHLKISSSMKNSNIYWHRTQFSHRTILQQHNCLVNRKWNGIFNNNYMYMVKLFLSWEIWTYVAKKETIGQLATLLTRNDIS